jgi:pilus assembly protein Flp/PilA
MSKLLNLAKNLAKDEEGTALVEYTILIGVVAVAVIGFAAGVSTWTSGKWQAFCTTLGC